MSKSVMIIDTPIDCCDCPFGTIAFGKSVCLLDEGNGIECPLKPYKDFVPIEWIKKYIDSTLDEGNSQMLGFKAAIIKEMVEEWEEENEKQTVE